MVDLLLLYTTRHTESWMNRSSDEQSWQSFYLIKNKKNIVHHEPELCFRCLQNIFRYLYIISTQLLFLTGGPSSGTTTIGYKVLFRWVPQPTRTKFFASAVIIRRRFCGERLIVKAILQEVLDIKLQPNHIFCTILKFS